MFVFWFERALLPLKDARPFVELLYITIILPINHAEQSEEDMVKELNDGVNS